MRDILEVIPDRYSISAYNGVPNPAWVPFRKVLLYVLECFLIFREESEPRILTENQTNAAREKRQ